MPYCTSRTLEDPDLPVALLEHFVCRRHELILDIIRRVRVVEINVLHLACEAVHGESRLGPCPLLVLGCYHHQSLGRSCTDLGE